MSSFVRIVVVGGSFALLMSASARAEVAWDKADPARAVLVSVRSAVRALRDLSSPRPAAASEADGCSTSASGAQSAKCTSATITAEKHVPIDDPLVVYRELPKTHRFAVAAPIPFAMARPLALPGVPAVPWIDFVAPLANAFSLGPQLRVLVAPAVRPFLPAVVVPHVL
jgi:hypothetical protein